MHSKSIFDHEHAYHLRQRRGFEAALADSPGAAGEENQKRTNQRQNMKTFVLSDESLNSQGFRVMTGGIDLSQFEKNPVMLYDHDSGRLPLGWWENMRVEGGRLLADAVFDQEDEFAKKVEKKVEQGIIKCCSIGFKAVGFSDDPALLLPGQRFETVTQSLLLECSICAIGANRNAMSLYDEAGERVELTEERMLSAGFKKLTVRKDTNNDVSMTEQEIKALQDENKNLKEQMAELAKELQWLRKAAAENHKKSIKDAIDRALEDGRIEESSRECWEKLMEADYDSAEKALGGMQMRQSLSEMMKSAKPGSQWTGKSWEEIDKAGKLSEFKEQDPEGFKSLYFKTFGVEYK